MSYTLTRGQNTVMRFIESYVASAGISPTLNEIGEHMGVSRVTIHEHVRELLRKGRLERPTAGVSRGLRIPGRPETITVVEIRDMGRPPGGNELKSLNHWDYKKIRDNWQMRLMAAQVPQIPTPCTLTLTVFSSGKMDLDNVAACAKIPLDCLQRLGKLEEDNTDHITELRVRHEKSTRKTAGIRLEFAS